MQPLLQTRLLTGQLSWRRLLGFIVFWLLPVLPQQSQFLRQLSNAEAASIKNVQRGTVTFTSGANRMAVTLSLAVDPSKTIVWGGISHGGGRFSTAGANATRIAFDLESSTTLALERLGSPANSPVVEWQAVEFDSGVSVQRGLRSMTTAETTVNVTIPSSVDLNKSFVLVSVAPNSAGVNVDERWTIRSRLTTSTNLELSRNESGTAVDVYWQVIEMQGASVQRGLTTIPSSSAAATAAISSVDTSKSFLILSSKAAAAVNGIESQYAFRGTITNSTLLTFSRVFYYEQRGCCVGSGVDGRRDVGPGGCPLDYGCYRHYFGSRH